MLYRYDLIIHNNNGNYEDSEFYKQTYGITHWPQNKTIPKPIMDPNFDPKADLSKMSTKDQLAWNQKKMACQANEKEYQAKRAAGGNDNIKSYEKAAFEIDTIFWYEQIDGDIGSLKFKFKNGLESPVFGHTQPNKIFKLPIHKKIAKISYYQRDIYFAKLEIFSKNGSIIKQFGTGNGSLVETIELQPDQYWVGG